MDELLVWSNVKAGSETDFSLLYQHFAPAMLRYGNRMTGDRELTRDCLQQVFLTVWKNRESLACPGSVHNYLLRAMRNEIIRRSQRDKHHDSLPENYHFEQEDSYEQVLIRLQATEITRQRIASLLASLPARQREVIFLKYYANLKYDDIAAIMEIEQASVYKITYKAIARLQQLLSKAVLLLAAFLLS